MTLTILSSRFANAEKTAIVIVTKEAGAVAVSARDTPDIWPAALASKPAAYTPPPEPPAIDPVAKLADFLRANPDVRNLIDKKPAESK